MLPLGLTTGFIHIGAEMGVLLLLFMLGLEYTADELRDNLRVGLPAGAVDFLFNFPPGLAAGLLFGWSLLPSVLLGGVTWVSSSGIIAKVLADQRRLKNPEHRPSSPYWCWRIWPWRLTCRWWRCYSRAAWHAVVCRRF